jgi:hypothetical protein|tara:strand:+ start:183 stop:326 length:144 start_codon:yes stop_codon:yes gene_type:complete
VDDNTNLVHWSGKRLAYRPAKTPTVEWPTNKKLSLISVLKSWFNQSV